MTADGPSLSNAILTDPALAPGTELLADGRAMAREWRLGRSAFMAAEG